MNLPLICNNLNIFLYKYFTDWLTMSELMEDNDPFEEDIVFDQAGLLGGKSSRSRHNNGFFPTFMLFTRTIFLCVAFIGLVSFIYN